jgi:hypothetical protein
VTIAMVVLESTTLQPEERPQHTQQIKEAVRVARKFQKWRIEAK